MEDIIKEKIKEPLLKEGIRVEEVSYGIEDNEKTLFVKIDSDKNVDTDMCVKASEIINPILDELDLIQEEYVLDVCSKGVIE